jgi:hypothetical protein
VAGGCVVTGLLVLLGLGPTLAWPQSSSASYVLPRQSVDGGAARSNSASYALEATLAQPDANAPSSSASYQLTGGFHRGVAPAGPLPDALFEDGFENP